MAQRSRHGGQVLLAWVERTDDWQADMCSCDQDGGEEAMMRPSSHGGTKGQRSWRATLPVQARTGLIPIGANSNAKFMMIKHLRYESSVGLNDAG